MTLTVLSVPTKILMCLCVPKKSAILACLTMSKLKMNWRVPNKNADLRMLINEHIFVFHILLIKLLLNYYKLNNYQQQKYSMELN